MPEFHHFHHFRVTPQARVDLEEAQKNKDRLKGRGSAAILKKEEAMAKQIKLIPKVSQGCRKLAGLGLRGHAIVKFYSLGRVTVTVA